MRKKLAILVIISVLFTIIGWSQVFADNNYSLDLQIVDDKEEIQPGDTVTYEVKVSNINAGSGISNFSMTIDYDDKVFDLTTLAGDKGKWEKDEQASKMDPKKLFIATSDLKGTKEEQTIATVKLTAKENADIGDYTVIFKDIRFSAEDLTDIQVENTDMKISVVSGTYDEEPYSDTEVLTTERNNNIQEPIKNKNVAWDIFEVILIIVAVVLILLTIMVYSRYRKSKNEE